MLQQDAELLNDFVVESIEHLSDVESQLLKIEEMGAQIDTDLVNTVFRAIHSVKGAAGFLGLNAINKLAHSLENVLNQIRNSELTPNGPIVDRLLRSADLLRNLIIDVNNSNSVDVSQQVAEMDAIFNGEFTGQDQAATATAEASQEADVPQSLQASGKKNSKAKPKASRARQSKKSTAEVACEQVEKIYEDVASLHDLPAEPADEVEQDSAPLALEPSPAPQADSPVSPVPGKPSKAVESSVRVNVTVLDRLMNLAGELVLSRNQLLLNISGGLHEGLESVANRVDQITSDLQETIMQTRMQPLGTIFNRFPRVVRDLSAKLGKECVLEIEGNEVEVDKSIVELMGDPLTHLIRNSVDHGVETPDQRRAAKKPVCGTIRLRAFHQAGKVCVRIEDDGAGIDPVKLKKKAISNGILQPEAAVMMSDADALRLIFAPGFSTAAQVTDVSGRGVGMDVVKTNIEQLGGTVDVESTPGQGAAMHITLPLTLAIIPSMIVECGSERFAIPQTNIAELVRITEEGMSQRIQYVQGVQVLRLRGALLPLISLSKVLNISDNERIDKGAHIIVLETGQQRYGLIVDGVNDSEEIVVKPLGRHLKDINYLAGATILGDGHVALILDVSGIAARAKLRNLTQTQEIAQTDEEKNKSRMAREMHRMLLFTNADVEQYAIPMAIVSRIERIKTSDIRIVGGRSILNYRDNVLPLLNIENLINATPRPQDLKHVFIVVFSIHGVEIGLVAPKLKDIRDLDLREDAATLKEDAVVGTIVVEGEATRILDMVDLAKKCYPDLFSSQEQQEKSREVTLMLAEDSDFFRRHVENSLKEEGFKLVSYRDGQEAWDALSTEQIAVDLIITDIEMPRMNGFELCKRIKTDQRFSALPVIALTSLAGEEDMKRGKNVGVDDYQIKMDRLQLLASVRSLLAQTVSSTR